MFNYTSVVRDMIRSAALDLYEDQAVGQAPCVTQSDRRDSHGACGHRCKLAGHNYPDMHSALLEHSGETLKQDVERMAQDIGLDVERFRSDLWSDKTWERIARDRTDAAKAGLEGHGGLIVDGRIYQGAWDEASLMEAFERPLGHRIMRAGAEFQNWAASAGMALVLATIGALLTVSATRQPMCVCAT